MSQLAFGQQQPPAPQLHSVFPAGAKAGETTTVKIVEQLELEFADELIFSHPGITAKPKLREKSRFFPNGSVVRNEFLVTIAKDVQPGTYEVRAKCEYGISNPRRFVVSQSHEVIEVEPNNTAEQATELTVDSVGNGMFEAGYDFFKVKVKPGQALLFRCLAEQIDSKGDPVIAVFDSDNRMVGKNHDANGKDSLVSFQASREEEIFIRVNDLTFTSQGGAGTTPYRLQVSSAPWIDFVDPPVIQKGVDTKVRLTGRNLGGGQSGIQKDGTELETLEVTINSDKLLASNRAGQFAETCLPPSLYSSNRIVYQFQGPNGKSNPVLLELSDGPLIPEDENKREIQVGNEVLGVFSQPGEIDQYRFTAKKGEWFWIEVVSQRLGIDTDPLLVIESIQKNKEGEETYRTLVTVDDFNPMERPFRLRLETEDPATVFEAPSDGEYRISINDQFNLPANQNGPNYYKLSFGKLKQHVDLVAMAGLECGQNDNHARPLKVLPCVVRPNAGAEIQVFAYRSPGFDRPIEFVVEGLPAGVTAHPCVMSGSLSHATIVLSGAADLKSGFGKVKITGKVKVDGKELLVPVVGAEILANSVGNEPSESRLTDEIWVIADAAVEYPGHIELPKKEFETAVGGVIEAKAKFVKHPQHTGPILQGYVHGLPRTVNKNSNTIQDNGTEVNYRIDFRQGTLAGEYSAFVRGYFEKNVKRFEKKMAKATDEQKRLNTVIQKVESEYRDVTRKKQALVSKLSQQKQSVARLATQIRTSMTQVAAAQKDLDAATKTVNSLMAEVKAVDDAIKSLGQMSDLEKDSAKQQKIAAELAVKKQKKAELDTKLAGAKTALESAKNSMSRTQTAHDKLLATENGAKQELTSLEKEQTELTEKEKVLTAERTLGQNLKREFDQEVNLARQAARDRRCRFLVYSEPIRFKVAEYPIELDVSKTNFALEQGKTEKITLNLKRLFDYKGTVNVELRPGSGANGWGLKQTARLNEKTNSIEAEVVVQKYAKVGKFDGEFRVTMRNGNANLTKVIPVEFEVKAAPKKQ